MNTTLKLNSIIKALENIDPESLHGLCDDLVYAGALIPDLKHNAADSAGWNPSKHHTISSPADNIIELESGLCVLEYSREENWVRKLKSDVESIQQWAEKESHVLVRFIFITTRDIGSKELDDGEGNKLSPKEYIRKKLSQFDVQANVFGQKSLLVALQNSDYFYIRRRWLNISDDYFQSLNSFESNHIKQAQDRHIYLEKFVETSSRKQSINALEEFVVQADVRVLLIHSQGGIGKTRFVLESLKRVIERTKNIDILFSQRKQHVNVDEVIPEISKDRKSLIVLDDPHLIDNLADFEEILIGRNRTKFILITRSTAKEAVKQQISYLMEELELTPLDIESSIELLKGNLENPLLDQYLKHIPGISEGNPLLIGITAHLINTTPVQSFGDLKTDNLIWNYLETILADLNQYSQVNRNHYEPYLALLFLFKPFSVDDVETRLLIQSLMNIDKITERLLRRDLEQCTVLERHGSTLWLYPDLLGEYLVKTTFFTDTRILDFDEIFSKIPASNIEGVFKTLRELDNAHANRFLKGWARDLSRDVESQDNDELSDNLRLLEIIASIVPDETLEIIDYLLKPESEKPPKTREYMWSPRPREYCEVLSQCLRIVENSGLIAWDFDETLEMLLTMHFYKPQVEEYSALRKEAFEAIVATAAHNLNLWQQGCGYTIQTRMFGKAQKWKQEDLEKYLPLILGVCENLLQTKMRSDYADSEGIGWSVSPVVVTDNLIGLRKDVISLLQLIFDKVHGSQQIKVICVLNCATEYPSIGQYGKDMEGMLRDNSKALIDFYLTLVKRSSLPEMRVLQEIEKQAYHLKDWGTKDIKAVNSLLSLLLSTHQYQVYRTLTGDALLLWGRDGNSSNEMQTEINDKIKEIRDAITHENLIEWLETLNEIAESFPYTSDHDTSRFCQLLREIGKIKPHIAQALIDKSLSRDNALKGFTSEFIRGMRESSQPDIAGNYVREWLSSEDQTLFLQIPQTYRGVNEKFVNARDLEIFETLQNCKVGDKKQRQELDKAIMFDIRWIYKENPERAINIICQIVKRSDQNSISHHLNQLCWSGGQIDLSQWDLDVFEELLQRLVDIPALNYNAVKILAQYAQKAPLELVKFFERRLEKQKQLARDGIFQYYAIPHFLKELVEIYRDHPQYNEIVNQILRWFQKVDYNYDTAAAELISGISPEINDQLRVALSGLIQSASRQNTLAAMQLLEKYPDDQISDELYEEIVKHSAIDRDLQKDIKSRILSVGHRRLQYWRQRFKSWIAGDDIHLREFAQRAIEDLESLIEFNERRTAEDKIKRKKGLM